MGLLHSPGSNTELSPSFLLCTAFLEPLKLFWNYKDFIHHIIMTTNCWPPNVCYGRKMCFISNIFHVIPMRVLQKRPRDSANCPTSHSYWKSPDLKLGLSLTLPSMLFLLLKYLFLSTSSTVLINFKNNYFNSYYIYFLKSKGTKRSTVESLLLRSTATLFSLSDIVLCFYKSLCKHIPSPQFSSYKVIIHSMPVSLEKHSPWKLILRCLFLNILI